MPESKPLVKECLPKQGLTYHENMPTLVLCKPKLLPLKSVSLEKMEKVQREAQEIVKQQELQSKEEDNFDSHKMSSMEKPWQYSFPPFFTIQPNLDTRKKQLEAWCHLVLDMQRTRKSYTLDINEAESSIFSNKEINRKLPLDGIHMVLEELRVRGHLEWKDPKTKKECLIMWRTAEEWGKMIYKYICDKSMTNTVCTLFELSNGDDTEDQDFHGIESWLLLRALKTLEQQGKAELISFNGNDGVKFF